MSLVNVLAGAPASSPKNKEEDSDNDGDTVSFKEVKFDEDTDIKKLADEHNVELRDISAVNPQIEVVENEEGGITIAHRPDTNTLKIPNQSLSRTELEDESPEPRGVSPDSNKDTQPETDDTNVSTSDSPEPREPGIDTNVKEKQKKKTREKFSDLIQEQDKKTDGNTAVQETDMSVPEAKEIVEKNQATEFESPPERDRKQTNQTLLDHLLGGGDDNGSAELDAEPKVRQSEVDAEPDIRQSESELDAEPDIRQSESELDAEPDIRQSSQQQDQPDTAQTQDGSKDSPQEQDQPNTVPVQDGGPTGKEGEISTQVISDQLDVNGDALLETLGLSKHKPLTDQELATALNKLDEEPGTRSIVPGEQEKITKEQAGNVIDALKPKQEQEVNQDQEAGRPIGESLTTLRDVYNNLDPKVRADLTELDAPWDPDRKVTVDEVREHFVEKGILPDPSKNENITANRENQLIAPPPEEQATPFDSSEIASLGGPAEEQDLLEEQGIRESGEETFEGEEPDIRESDEEGLGDVEPDIRESDEEGLGDVEPDIRKSPNLNQMFYAAEQGDTDGVSEDLNISPLSDLNKEVTNEDIEGVKEESEGILSDFFNTVKDSLPDSDEIFEGFKKVLKVSLAGIVASQSKSPIKTGLALGKQIQNDAQNDALKQEDAIEQMKTAQKTLSMLDEEGIENVERKKAILKRNIEAATGTEAMPQLLNLAEANSKKATAIVGAQKHMDQLKQLIRLRASGAVGKDGTEAVAKEMKNSIDADVESNLINKNEARILKKGVDKALSREIDPKANPNTILADMGLAEIKGSSSDDSISIRPSNFVKNNRIQTSLINNKIKKIIDQDDKSLARGLAGTIDELKKNPDIKNLDDLQRISSQIEFLNGLANRDPNQTLRQNILKEAKQGKAGAMSVIINNPGNYTETELTNSFGGNNKEESLTNLENTFNASHKNLYDPEVIDAKASAFTGHADETTTQFLSDWAAREGTNPTSALDRLGVSPNDMAEWKKRKKKDKTIKLVKNRLASKQASRNVKIFLQESMSNEEAEFSKEAAFEYQTQRVKVFQDSDWERAPSVTKRALKQAKKIKQAKKRARKQSSGKLVNYLARIKESQIDLSNMALKRMVKRVVMGSFSGSMNERWQTAGDVVEDLRNINPQEGWNRSEYESEIKNKTIIGEK